MAEKKKVIFSNWKCSLPVNELGCNDKFKKKKSAHPIKEPGKFPFWYPFSFFSHVSFVKEHSSWNEIKGFIYLFLASHTNLVPCIMQIWQCHFIKNHSVCLTILITSQFSMTKTIWEWLKALRSNNYKQNEIQNVWSVETKQFSVFNSLTDWNKYCHFEFKWFITLFPESRTVNCLRAFVSSLSFWFDICLLPLMLCELCDFDWMYSENQSIKHHIVATFQTLICKSQIYSISIYFSQYQ